MWKSQTFDENLATTALMKLSLTKLMMSTFEHCNLASADSSKNLHSSAKGEALTQSVLQSTPLFLSGGGYLVRALQRYRKGLALR